MIAVAPLPVRALPRLPFARTRKALVGLFFLVCVFFNPVIDERNNLYVSHIAVIVLFALSVLLWLLGGRWNISAFMPRQSSQLREGAQGRMLKGLVVAAFLFYYSQRAWSASSNPWFFGEISKIGVVLLAFLSYRILDPDAENFATWAWFLPGVLALAILTRMFFLALEGQLLTYRLNVETLGSSIALGYMSGTLIGLCLFSMDLLQKRWKFLLCCALTGVMALGVFLSLARNGAFAAALVFSLFGRRSTGRFSRKVLLTIIVLVVLWETSSYTIGGFVVSERLNVVENPTLTGRVEIWQDWLDILLRDWPTTVFGAGLGADKPINPATGDFSRDPHNMLLDVAVSFGLVGLLGYLLFLARIYLGIRRLPNSNWRHLALALFWAFVLTDLFDTHWRQSLVLWYTGFLFHIFVSSHSRGAWPSALTAVRASRVTLPHLRPKPAAVGAVAR